MKTFHFLLTTDFGYVDVPLTVIKRLIKSGVKLRKESKPSPCGHCSFVYWSL